MDKKQFLYQQTTTFRKYIMNTKILITILLIFFNSAAFAKHKIVTSITPIASIAAILFDESEIEIDSIATSTTCPHYYQAKPSDIYKIQSADINILINEDFDGFATKLMNNYSNNVIKISDFKKLNIIYIDNQPNWHIWLDLENVKILLEEFRKIFISKFPELTQSIDSNFEYSLKELEILITTRNSIYNSLHQTILFSDSLEYLFRTVISKKLYEHPYKSLEYIQRVESQLNNNLKQCLIFDVDQNIEFYKRFHKPIIKIESENWQLITDIKKLYNFQYNRFLESLKQCMSN